MTAPDLRDQMAMAALTGPKERPILFSGPMVRALLDGRKTQTRRMVKPQPPTEHDFRGASFALDRAVADGVKLYSQNDYDRLPKHPTDWSLTGSVGVARDAGFPMRYRCPYGAPGDRLWVKESWWIATKYSYGTTPEGCEIDPPPLAHRRYDPVRFAADGDPPNCANRHYGPDGLAGGWFAAPDPYAVWVRRPGIHMPRWASRLTLEITDVRVERLQQISEADAEAEGAEYGYGEGAAISQRRMFELLWESINGADSWDANPWVWVVSFQVRTPADAMLAQRARTTEGEER